MVTSQHNKMRDSLVYRSEGGSSLPQVGEATRRLWYMYAKETKETPDVPPHRQCKCLILRRNEETTCGGFRLGKSKFCVVHTRQKKNLWNLKNQSTALRDNTSTPLAKRVAAAKEVIVARERLRTIFNDKEKGHEKAVIIDRQILNTLLFLLKKEQGEEEARKLAELSLRDGEEEEEEEEEETVQEGRKQEEEAILSSEEKLTDEDVMEEWQKHNISLEKERKRKEIEIQVEGMKKLNDLQVGELMVCYVFLYNVSNVVFVMKEKKDYVITWLEHMLNFELDLQDILKDGITLGCPASLTSNYQGLETPWHEFSKSLKPLLKPLALFTFKDAVRVPDEAVNTTSNPLKKFISVNLSAKYGIPFDGIDLVICDFPLIFKDWDTIDTKILKKLKRISRMEDSFREAASRLTNLFKNVANEDMAITNVMKILRVMLSEY